MSKTSNFALRTFPEFKEAAQALATQRVLLYEKFAGPGGQQLQSGLDTSSINGAFNTLIAKGIPSVLARVDEELSIRQGALGIAQEIMRFLLNHPAAKRALATNFPDGSPAQRVLAENDAAKREADENDGGVSVAGSDLTGAEEEIFCAFAMHARVDQDGVSRDEAASALAYYQRHVEDLTNTKGALQRALATQGEYGTRAPV